jgi:hypothetical protein
MKKSILFALGVFLILAMTDMAGAISPRDDPDAPDRPVLSSPTDASTDVSLTPELQTGAFSDPNPGDTHAETRWQISAEDDFSSLIMDLTSGSHLTSFSVPDFVLNVGTTYYWRVIFYDNNEVESTWSNPFSFTTVSPSVEDTSLYASYVVGAVGGKRYSGEEMPVVKDQKNVWPLYERDDGVHALGPPDYDTLNPDGFTGGFASGWSNYGGYMILGFDATVTDLTGVDLVLYHWGPGVRDLDHSTSFVHVSENGTDWVELAELGQSNRGVIITDAYDFLDHDGVDNVNYVKIIKNYNGIDTKKCGKFIDAVVGNPPYIPVEDTDENGIPDEQEIDYTGGTEQDILDMDDNGTNDDEECDQIKCVKTLVGNGQMGVRISTNVTSINTIRSVDPATVTETENRPDSMPLGLILFKVKVENVGDEAEVSVYLSEPVADDGGWYKYDAINGWQDYSELGYATFGEDRKSVTLRLKDGGYGDLDLSGNGVIIDPSGPGIPEVGDDIYTTYGTDSDTRDEGGCFIATAGRADRLWMPAMAN